MHYCETLPNLVRKVSDVFLSLAILKILFSGIFNYICLCTDYSPNKTRSKLAHFPSGDYICISVLFVILTTDFHLTLECKYITQLIEIKIRVIVSLLFSVV